MPQQIPLYDWSELAFVLTNQQTYMVLPQDSRRLAVEFSALGMNAYHVSTSPQVTTTIGRYANANSGPIVYLYKDWGDLVKSAWYAYPDAAGWIVLVKQLFLLGYGG